MRPFIHHYVLPPVFLTIHALLLLPLLLWKPVSDSNSGPHQPSNPTKTRWHLLLSLPIGVAALLVMVAVRKVISSFPIPVERRRRRLAKYLEWSMLFALGVIEEFWRWGLVRIVLHLEGGKGHYGEMNPTGYLLAKNDSVWRGVYIMCWAWGFIESIWAWFSVWPVNHDIQEPPSVPRHPSASRRRKAREGQIRRPRYYSYGSFRNPFASPKHGNASSDEENRSVSSTTLHRNSDASKSSSKSSSKSTRLHNAFHHLLKSDFQDASSSEDENNHSDHAAPSENSSDGDDEAGADDSSLEESGRWSEDNNNTEYTPLVSTAPPPPHHPSIDPNLTITYPLPIPLAIPLPPLPPQPAPAPAPPPALPSFSSMTLFTLPIATLPALYPIIWRLTSALTHLGYGLLYASLPPLFPANRGVHWASLALLGLVASGKGVSCVLWVTGKAAALGAAWASGVCLGVAGGVYSAGLAVWGIGIGAG
ncbi:MAG: hypothetical protein M1829_003327 [Trizodia sp. TS-e1964]|nr:MAG: hypothetical protein M1829_003327 [Trizodia sp. TS-e1964]